MTRIAIIDESRHNARLLAAPLITAGHQVMIVSPPASIEMAVAFRPQLVMLSLYRKPEAFRRPIWDFEADVAGAQTLGALDRQAALRDLPRVLIGHSLEQEDLPPDLAFHMYLACQVQPQMAMPVVGRVCLEQMTELTDAPALAPALAAPAGAPEIPYTAVIITCEAPDLR